MSKEIQQTTLTETYDHRQKTFHKNIVFILSVDKETKKEQKCN